MAVSHVKSDTVANWTGTVTVFNSQGSTGTIAATDLVRPGDWNSVHNQFYSLLGNTSLSSTASGTNVQYSATGAGLTLIGSSDTVVLSTPPHISSFQNLYPLGGSTTVSLNSTSLALSHCVSFNLGEPGSFSFLRLPVSMTTGSTTAATTAASLSASCNVTTTWQAVVYQVNTGANSRSLTWVASGSVSWVQQNSISVAAAGNTYSLTENLTYYAEGSSTSTSTSTSTAAQTNLSFQSFLQSNLSGNRWLDINFANSLSAGAYWLIFGFSTASATNSTGISFASNAGAKYSYHHAASNNAPFFGIMNSTNLTSGGQFGMGSFSTAGGGTTAALPISAISSSATNNFPIFQLIRSS